jgi:hypothetical protein
MGFLQKTKTDCMKNAILWMTFVLLSCSSSGFAQSSDAEADAVANLLGVQKKEIITKLVPVTGKDSVNFWKIYNE